MAEERLARAIEALVEGQNRPPPPAGPVFKAPQFDGNGDVEYFIQQFGDVAEANQWAGPAQLLFLREALKGEARECGKAPGTDGVFNNLRARYGLTPREARARLATLRKERQVTLQEHATEVEKLVAVAYEEMTAEQRASMAVEAFAATLNHSHLQRHLLAVGTPTLEAAVRAGNEYLQIKPNYGGPAVRVVEDEEPEEQTRVERVSAERVLSTMAEAIQELRSQIEQLTARAGSGRPGRPSRGNVQPRKCWGCQKEGHLRKDCPVNPWETKKEAGNEEGPQQ